MVLGELVVAVLNIGADVVTETVAGLALDGVAVVGAAVVGF
jgi:hypothetical protein